MSWSENRDRFVELLNATNRDGIQNLITEIDRMGFFTAPASTRYHCADVGGLCRHSLHVYEQARALREAEIKLHPVVEDSLPIESVAIAALLHDVCKAEIYKPVLRNRKNEDTGKWESYQTYEAVYDEFPMGHGEKSVIRILNSGVKLTEAEMLAIRWHMGAWDISDTYEAKGCIGAASIKYPLVSLIMVADVLATRITEALVQ